MHFMKNSLKNRTNHGKGRYRPHGGLFYITANGAVNVRKPNDYIAQMIGLAGGTYVLNDRLSAEENALSTMNMQMEDFYAAAKDADILIYNSTIEGSFTVSMNFWQRAHCFLILRQ